MTLYETVRYYVYGGKNPFTGEPAAGVEAFVRFGSDSLNYYEVALPIVPGWTELEVPIAELAQIKVAEAADT